MKSMTQRARHVVTLALIGILCFQVPVQSFAQVGQTSMSQPSGVANGVVNRGLGALGSLNDAGPGFFLLRSKWCRTRPWLFWQLHDPWWFYSVCPG